MNVLLIILLVLAMAATAYVLVRGVVTMAQGNVGSSEKQQMWMRKRVMFQAIAIILVVLILLAAGASGS
ncbi:twin transmembrane helix small protein [Sphingomonas sabuli]|uniref:Twin transmembrane helix small protein n=1 Tax=Sphingomonas sabuli TaxID=2764186 RepID=A0A7G9KZI0_9SPHN|nr:twin transmembrane helix small protein [Sphingomonas sabuli]QNM81779.1 twin transmembrane helix small protein [Sphingomonas sabuli]